MKRVLTAIALCFVCAASFGQFTVVSKPQIKEVKIAGFNNENVYYVTNVADSTSYYTISTYRTYFFNGHVDGNTPQVYVKELKFFGKEELISFINSCYDISKNKTTNDNYVLYTNDNKTYLLLSSLGVVTLVLDGVYFYHGREQYCDNHCGSKHLQVSYLLQIRNKVINKIENFTEE